MRRRGFRIITLLTSLLVSAGTLVAFAAAPRFTRAEPGLLPDGGLVMSFEETGLPESRLVTVWITARATIQAECEDRRPNARKPRQTKNPTKNVRVAANFTADAQGRMQGRLIFQPPAGGCPRGTTRHLHQVSYRYVRLMDRTNHTWRDLPGTFEKTL